ncbi:MAG: MazG nucleotide pyrophosphohydrolase domain-containing protein [Thiolinea sp.]
MSQSAPSTAALQQLLTVMARLRDPQHGCPWDLKQTWRSIIPHTLEEVYEVADAVDRDDVAALQDELGDLLFQVVFMAQIAQDQGLFDFNDVAQGIAEKMIRRHPHIL